MSAYLNPEEFKALTERIKCYKEEIDLSTYIRETDKSYYKDDSKSTRTNHVLRKDDINGNAEEVISCWKRKADANSGPGHYMYANKLDTRDSGSIVEWVKSRHNTTSILDVDRILGDYTNNPQITYSVPKADKITAAPEVGRSIKVAQYFNLEPLKERDYLYSRGLDDNILDSKEFSGRVFNEKVVTKNGATFVNTVFPIFAKTGETVGIERKNYSYNDPQRSYSRTAAGSEKASGLWSSRHAAGSPVDKLFLSEAPMDAMSYHKLKHNGTDKMVYKASNGPWTEEQVDIVQSFINNEKPKQIILGHDNDPQGYKYNIHMAGQICRPLDFIEKTGDKVMPDSGIYTDDTSIKVKCTNAGRYHVNLDFDISYANKEQGEEVISSLKKKFAGLGQNEEGMPKFDVKVTKLGPNNAEMQVNFPNAIAELAQVRDLVIEVRKMDNYIFIEKPRDKDWNLDLTNSIEKAQQVSKMENLNKDEKLSTGQTVSKSMMDSFRNMGGNTDLGM